MKKGEKQPERQLHRVRLPGFLLEEEIGMGDAIKRVTYAVGIKPCSGCERGRGAQPLDGVLSLVRRGADLIQPSPLFGEGVPHRGTGEGSPSRYCIYEDQYLAKTEKEECYGAIRNQGAIGNTGCQRHRDAVVGSRKQCQQ